VQLIQKEFFIKKNYAPKLPYFKQLVPAFQKKSSFFFFSKEGYKFVKEDEEFLGIFKNILFLDMG
jgi:hypothetical protein